MAFLDRFINFFRRLQWKLTLSYTAVTVGALSIIVIILGYILFTNIFVPTDILNQAMTPDDWIQALLEKQYNLGHPSVANYVLSKEPIDIELINLILKEDLDLQITYFDLFQIGQFQIRMRTVAQGSAFIVSPDYILLGITDSELVSENAVGQPLDLGILPGLEGALQAAFQGELDPDQLMVTLEPNERFYIAIPYYKENEEEVLATGVLYIDSLPTAYDIPAITLMLYRRSVLVLLIAAGFFGTFFGALTARRMVKRLNRVSQVTDSWSQGDFSNYIEDSGGDEISQLATLLNSMAERLQHFFKRSQDMAVSEERNRLARDLHDSAKQEALAASFQLGTSLELFDKNPEGAKKHLIEAEKLVDSVRGELTDLIYELRPISINGTHFVETLNEYIIEWAHQTGIGTNFSVDGYQELSLELKEAIYRIMQEALANVARHSSAENVDIKLEFEDDSVQFSIHDDGAGFDPKGQHAGMGLNSMRERAESHQGNYKIESKLDEGTQIDVKFPLG
jgi:NarL family two-component system sensor histidine kinase LiaS